MLFDANVKADPFLLWVTPIGCSQHCRAEIYLCKTTTIMVLVTAGIEPRHARARCMAESTDAKLCVTRAPGSKCQIVCNVQHLPNAYFNTTSTDAPNCAVTHKAQQHF